jgi:hydrogenase maturation factor
MFAEIYFLKYAFPCAFIKLQRGKITKRQYDSLHSAALGKKNINRSTLEKFFAVPVGHIKLIAKKMNVDDWSIEAIREYFWEKHDAVIDSGDGFYADAPKVLCELCRVEPAEVLRKGGNWAVVKFANNKKRSVLSELVPRLKKGDRVIVHYGYIVEKLDKIEKRC